MSWKEVTVTLKGKEPVEFDVQDDVLTFNFVLKLFYLPEKRK